MKYSGTLYYFVVVAFNAGGDSPDSNVRSATPVAPVVNIETDNISAYKASSVASVSFNHTVTNTGSNRALVVSTSFYKTTTSPQTTTLSYGGRALTLIDRQVSVSGSSYYVTELWYLLDPPTGNNTVNATFNTSVTYVGLISVSLRGVKQQAPEVIRKASGNSASATVNLTTLTPGAWVIDSVVANVGIDTWLTPVASQTQLQRQANGSITGGMSYKKVDPAGSASMSWTIAFSKPWAIVAAAFAPASGQTALIDIPKDNAIAARYEEFIGQETTTSPMRSVGPNSWLDGLAGIVDFIFGVTEAQAQTVNPIDYTSFTVQGQTTKISLTSQCETFTNIETRSANTYVVKSHPTSGDFTYEFDTSLTSSDSFSGETTVWGVTNTANALYSNWADGVHLAWYKNGSFIYLRLQKISPLSSATSSNLSLNRRYYVRVKRIGGTVTAEIFSDPARTAKISTLTQNGGTGSYNYLYGFSTKRGTATGYKASGDACRLGVSIVSTQTLAVTKQGTGTGTVTSTPAGISCGSTCSADFNSGMSVTLNQSAATGATFAGWSGACAGTGACSVTMDAAKSVTATFNDTTAPAVPGGFIATAASSTQINLSWVTATDTGGAGLKGYNIYKYNGTSYVFLKQVLAPATTASDTGLSPATLYSYKISAIDNVNLESAQSAERSATTQARQTLSVTKSGTGVGTVTSTPAGIDCGSTCSAIYNYGTSVTLTPSAAAGSAFDSWSGWCTGAASCSVTMSGAKSVTAKFKDTQAPAAPSGVSFSNAASTSLNLNWNEPTDNVEVTGYRIDVAEDSNFATILDNYNNEDVGDVLLAQITGLTPGKTYWGRVRAYDAAANQSTSSDSTSLATLPTHTLTMTKSGTGAGTVTSTPAGIDCGSTCSADFNSGTSVTLNQSAATGATFAGWSGACAGTGACSVTMDAAKSVTATFNDTTAPAVPSGFIATAASSTEINLSWATATDTGGSGLKGYNIYKYNGTSYVFLKQVLAPATTASDPGLSPSTPYFYKISAIDNVNLESAQSAERSATTPALQTLTVTKSGTGVGTVTSTPAGIDCGATCNASFASGTDVTLNQTAATGSVFDGWSGWCTGTGSCSVTMNSASSVTAKFKDTQAPAAPSGVSFSNAASTSLNLNWNEPTDNVGVTGYRIDVAEDGNFSNILFSYKDADVGKVLSAPITGLTPEKTYWGRVRAYDAAANTSTSSTPASLTTLPTHTLTITKSGTGAGTVTSTPAGIDCGSTCSADFNSGTSVTLNQNAATGSVFEGWSGDCAGTGNCSLTMTAAKNVTATFADIQRPAAPGNLAISNVTATSFILSWDVASDNVGATGYRIDIATDNGFANIVSGFNNVDVGNVRTTSVTRLNPTTAYYARVRAYDAAGYISDNSSTNVTTAVFSPSPNTPQFTSVQPGNGYVVLQWQAVSGAIKYKIYYTPSTTNSSATLSGTTNYTISGLTNGMQYTFKISAFDSANTESPLSEPVSETPQVSALGRASITNTSVNQNEVTLTWGSVANATGYNVKYSKTSGGPYDKFEDAGNTTSRTIKYLDFNTTYYFVVAAYNATNVGEDSTQAAVNIGQPPTSPAAPALNPADAGDGRARLSWNQTATAESYTVYYGTSSGSHPQSLAAGNAMAATVDQLQNGTKYYFVVVATNSIGNSPPSNEVSATPQAPGAELYVRNVQYNAAGQKTIVEYGNGVVTEYEYDELNFRLLRIHTVNAQNQTLQDLRYSYDGVGNVVRIQDNLRNNAQDFVYDALGRLTQARSNTYGQKDYEYDAQGNVATKDNKFYYYGENAGPAHGLTSIQGGATFTYDENGNMLTQTDTAGQKQFIYDAENRLIQARKDSALIAEYKYDESGERVLKRAGGRTTHYVYPFYENAGVLDNDYVLLDGERIAKRQAGITTYLHPDHLGSDNVLTDGSGNQVDAREYLPFGEFPATPLPGSGGPRYTGQYYDEETGLYYYGARYYNPAIARFLTADSVIPDPANSQSFNRYSYVNNNPVNYVDPTGNTPETDLEMIVVTGNPRAYTTPYMQGVLNDLKSTAVNGVSLARDFISQHIPNNFNLNNVLNEIDSASNALLMTNPIPDQMPGGIGFADQAVGLFGIGTVKAARALEQASTNRIVIGETMKRVIKKAGEGGAKYYNPKNKLPLNATKEQIRKALQANLSSANFSP